MNSEEYSALYAKFLDGKCSTEERNLLLKYRDELNIQDFDNEERIKDQELIKSEIYTRLQSEISKTKLKRFNPWKYAVAASLLIVSSLALYHYIPKEKISFEPQVAATKELIKAGGNRATLTLGDGTEIDLTKIENGTVNLSSDVKITKTSSGEIIYSILDNPKNQSSPTFNTIRTPSGGEYQITLPDGTKVWLNAISSLKFPNKFTSKNREVELEGEAYFEVAKDASKPFSVSTKHTKVSVLGTHFNVMAYPEDVSTQTTLLEGSVRLSNATESLLLKPGEQGIVRENRDEITRKKVNIEDVVAWKNGYFVFEKENIKSIMKKVARWYGTEVFYRGNFENIRLGGTVSRSENITELLSKLELTGAVNFKIEGRKIYVISASN